MTITTTTLTRAAGLAAVAGGTLFIAVQIQHPVLDATFTTTTAIFTPADAQFFCAARVQAAVAAASFVSATRPPQRLVDKGRHGRPPESQQHKPLKLVQQPISPRLPRLSQQLHVVVAAKAVLYR